MFKRGLFFYVLFVYDFYLFSENRTTADYLDFLNDREYKFSSSNSPEFSDESVFFIPLSETNRLLRNHLTKNDLAVLHSEKILKIESVPHFSFMKFLYNKGRINDAARKLINTKILSKIYGYIQNRNISVEENIEFFEYLFTTKIYANNFFQFNSFVLENFGKNVSDYKTINEIFTRSLTQSTLNKTIVERNVAKNQVTSWSDARYRFFTDIDIDREFHLTDKTFGGTKNQFNSYRMFGFFEKNNLEENIYKKLHKHWDRNLFLKNSFLHEDQENAKKLLLDEIRINYKEINFWMEKLICFYLLQKVNHSQMVVSRLAPRDYHHIHNPFQEAAILSKKEIIIELMADEGFNFEKEFLQNLIIDSNLLEDSQIPYVHITGEFYSVSTVAMSSHALKNNPLTENVRDIMVFKVPSIGLVPMILVGATGVGKIHFLKLPRDQISFGDDLAYFGIGASSVVTFFPNNNIVPTNEIKKASSIEYEHVFEGKVITRQMEIDIPFLTPIYEIN